MDGASPPAQPLRASAFKIGFTAAGSLGLLFPLSVPLILYGIVAQNVAIEDLFIGGIVPGTLMLALLATLGIREAIRSHTQRAPFRVSEVMAGLWEAKWELLLPVVVVVLFASGVASMVEAAAAACAYSVVVTCFVQRDIRFGKPLAEVLLKAGSLMGAVRN